ncbi:hypothetical protein C0966_06735 [Bacillus methanolicus]|uniref:hypothetical protein n=1 Tax=Bacillus methanolicus TaxID=1471 RepID=UPI002380895F|nr:hypothetical protein [Bacillus methanolicus]MDE3839065.1 hypothetical protein [Bacillus methanolicus]
MEDLKDIEIYELYEYGGEYYYLEIFYFYDMIKVFCKKRVQFMIETFESFEESVGVGVDYFNKEKAIRRAIKDLKVNLC